MATARDFQPDLFTNKELIPFELAAHEWIGLTAYYLTGKIDNWFPSP